MDLGKTLSLEAAFGEKWSQKMEWKQMGFVFRKANSTKRDEIKEKPAKLS